ncbi:MAG: sulfide/dihydroorotate dehydrogenase-like FAD/NAD-binding protein [Propionibacteriaceae bacterium]|jgi:glutamate synthase (NADPH/NADH) small chain|nr:sulfide/dihydroorotate dehydrogenase-like FAD/NAD-binding protein [Propionibacteriaceae bacterium]
MTAVPETISSDALASRLAILRRRLEADPRSFQGLVLADAMVSIAAEFKAGNVLSAAFVNQLWNILLAGGDAATTLMRFIWDLPVGRKRIWLRGVDEHLRDRYPMVEGLSASWPAENSIGPYIVEADVRSDNFGLVNRGYIGYMELGYSLREVELLVWLEAIRDKQCAARPCEVGKPVPDQPQPKGGCPVRIHIPDMFRLLGQGRFDEALALVEASNPLPNVTGRVCPQELQCQGVCIHKLPMSIGQVEWFLPEWDKQAHPGGAQQRFKDVPDPWTTGLKPPIAIIGSGPAGLINAYLLAREGFPVTVFEAFHELGGVLRYGIPEFRLPNQLIDDVVEKIRLLGGRFVTNFVVGKTATLRDLTEAGFWKVFVGTGAGLPTFLNVPGEHLLGVMSANEFLTRVNLMHADLEEYDTPLPEVRDKQVLIIGGGNTAMDAARTARRLGGNVTIVYRRTQAEMPARVEELHHALEEGIGLATLQTPIAFEGDETNFVTTAIVETMELGEPDASGRRRPLSTGKTQPMPADLVIMALGNTSNPIIRDSEPDLAVTPRGAIQLREGSQETSLDQIFSGGDAARGGSTAIRAAGDGQTAAREIIGGADIDPAVIPDRVARAHRFTDLAASSNRILEKIHLSPGIEEFVVASPVIARAAQAGQFVRVLHKQPTGELIPLTLADWDAEAGWIDLVIQGMGVSSLEMNQMQPGDQFAGIAGPLGLPSELRPYPSSQTVVFTAGGLGLPPVYPIMREHLRLGNHVTLIAGFRSKDLMFWHQPGERVENLKAQYGDQLDVIYTTNDGSFGVEGFVTTPLEQMLKVKRPIAEVTTIGPPIMMRVVADLTRSYDVHTVASLNSIMVDATGMCGACMVPVQEGDKLVRRHACVDGPEIDAHMIDWDKFLPRFNLFKKQEAEARQRAGL